MTDPIRAALAELVSLKDLKDRLHQLHEMGHGTDYGNYHRRQPLAWDAARVALATPVQAVAQSVESPASWISVEERLPEPNIEVLCAGRGWADPFVTCCYYDEEQKGWWTIRTHWTDYVDSQQYPTHWMPLPAPPQDADTDSRQPKEKA